MNLAGIIEPHPAAAVAFRAGRGSVTYAALRASSSALQDGLEHLGVEPGERVALLFGASPEFAVGYLGVLATGAVAVPLNPASPPAELHRELTAVGTKLVLTEASIGSGTTVAELAGLGHDIRALEEVGSTARDHAGDDGAAVPAPVDRNPSDPAVLLFTSGTAGSPKAAVLTHGNLLANIEQIECRVGLATTASDIGILAVPPFHILGLNAVMGVQLYAGGSLVLMDRFEPHAMLSAIADEHVTILAGVPQLFSALAECEGASREQMASVRLACSGAAPLSEDVAAKFEAVFGIRLWQGYGLTEASPIVTFPDLSGPYRATSVGLPLPGVELRVVDADGGDVEAGDPGEILVRGPNVFAGYFEDQAATAQAVDRTGWLHTGDLAVMSDDGQISIVDRGKDLIIVSGFNVFPAEVEKVLVDHPDVEDAVVVGVPDRVQGESVRALVVPRPGLWPEGSPEPDGLSAEALIGYCGTRLARYKCPTSVSFVREVPRGVQGKVLRRAIS